MANDNRCVCRGEIIPEGMIAYPNCLVVSKCEWCEPKHEICGTCKQFFGDGADNCSAGCYDEQCVVYEPIDYCPKCGRKLRTEDAN